MFLTEEIKKFHELHPKSKKIWQKALTVLPGGISHTIRTFELTTIGGFPVSIQSAYGPYMKDVDEIEYVDFWNGHQALILGHNHPEVREVLREYLNNGWHYGTITEYQLKLAKLLVQDNTGVERVRFCTSGTEATMYAVRLARAFTKRRKVAKSLIGWHGANDTLHYDPKSMQNGIAPPGLPPPTEAGVLLLDVNEDSTFDLIEKNKDQLAAIIIEPVIGAGGGFAVELEYLKKLREETEKYGIILIFDEIITGYRFTDSLFQNKLKIIPDLTTMGKIIGGGLPIGAIGGRSDIIESSSPQAKHQVLIGGGTFSGYPLSMLAGLKTIEILKKSQNKYERINRFGNDLINNYNEFFEEEHLPVMASGYKSIVKIHVLKKYIDNPTIKEIVEEKDKNREALLYLALFNRNSIVRHGVGCISMAHSEDNMKHIQESLKEVIKPVCESSINS